VPDSTCVVGLQVISEDGCKTRLDKYEDDTPVYMMALDENKASLRNTSELYMRARNSSINVDASMVGLTIVLQVIDASRAANLAR